MKKKWTEIKSQTFPEKNRHDLYKTLNHVHRLLIKKIDT